MLSVDHMKDDVEDDCWWWNWAQVNVALDQDIFGVDIMSAESRTLNNWLSIDLMKMILE